MPSTHVSVHLHIIFSTKNRQPIIDRVWRQRLHAYLGGLTRSLGAVAEAVGGTQDHVHLLVSFCPTHQLAEYTRQLKGQSSRWIRENLRQRSFHWQAGYGAFSVSPSRLPAVRRYIERQEEHHRKRTFQEEYLGFLRDSGVKYDTRYLW